MPSSSFGEAGSRTVLVAVVGAHLSGEPLNWQLTDRGATLQRSARTSANYRLFALPGTQPPKPGLLRVAMGGSGGGIELEVWEMPLDRFGDFVMAIPAPLSIGSIELEDGMQVKGFLCESYVTDSARDITSFGGWRAFLRGG